MVSGSEHDMSTAQNSDEVEPFVYSPLKHPANLRLLHLQPGTGGEPIVLEIFELPCSGSRAGPGPIQLGSQSLKDDDLKFWDEGDYRALSYVWGDARDTTPIQVNGCQSLITTNLHAFQKAIREPDVNTGPLWADAICINQTDNVEKATQVAMMDRIYSETTLCAVWFGEESDGTKDAFQVFHSVAEEAKRLCRENPAYITPPDPETDPSEMAIIGSVKLQEQLQKQLLSSAAVSDDQTTKERSLRAWDLALSIFPSPWFTRVWTLQEFILPKNLSIRCGTHSIDAESFSICSEVFGAFEDLLMLDSHEKDYKPLQRVFAICSYRTRVHRFRQQRQSHIVEQVIAHRDKDATVPQDRIFALLSLAKKASFDVDYEKPVEDVYTSFAAYGIGGGMLDLILKNAAGVDAAVHTGIPTWVPDWRLRGRAPYDLTASVGNIYSGAGGSAKTTPRLSEDLTSLYVDALVLGRLEVVYEDTVWDMEKVQDLQRLLVKKYSFKNPQSSGQSLEQAILRTLRADVLDNNPMAAKRFGTSRASHDMFDAYPWRYNLFFTANGYLGLTRRTIGKEGDFVAVARGVTLPDILRQKDDYFQFVDGSSYGKSYLPMFLYRLSHSAVHGVMDGKITEDVASGKLRFEVIELR